MINKDIDKLISDIKKTELEFADQEEANLKSSKHIINFAFWAIKTGNYDNVNFLMGCELKREINVSHLFTFLSMMCKYKDIGKLTNYNSFLEYMKKRVSEELPDENLELTFKGFYE